MLAPLLLLQTGAEERDGSVHAAAADWCCCCRLVLRKEIRKQKVLIDGREETIVTEDVQLVQDHEEPDQLKDSVQSVVNQFMQGGTI